tara:strand:+ start:597 stop:1004 length:408 start_codon:yes stop_codon:yes gene_type:complete
MKLYAKDIVSIFFLFAIFVTSLSAQNGQISERGYPGAFKGSLCSATVQWSTVGGYVEVKGELAMKSGAVVRVKGDEVRPGFLKLLIEKDPLVHHLSQTDVGGKSASVGYFLSLRENGENGSILVVNGWAPELEHL